MVKLFEEEIHIMQLFYANQSIRNVRDISNASNDTRVLLTVREKHGIVNYCFQRRELTPLT
jgi:hypothetical protein